VSAITNKRFLSKAWRFLANEDGPTSVEYAVVLMLVFGAVITVVEVFGFATQSSIEGSTDTINAAVEASKNN